MSQPYSYMAMAGLSSEVLDRARSKIVAQMLHGILAAAEEGSRLGTVTATGAEIAAAAASARLQRSSSNPAVDEAAAKAYSSSSSSGVALTTAGLAGVVDAEGRLRRALAMPAATAAAVYAPASVLQAHHQQQQQQQQWPQPIPEVPLHEQPVHLRSQVLLLLTVFDVLAAWGVVLRHDAALAAGLQVLRYCWDTEDARQSGEPACHAYHADTVAWHGMCSEYLHLACCDSVALLLGHRRCTTRWWGTNSSCADMPCVACHAWHMPTCGVNICI
jgi:hypothetical protein